jgi:hypothetical protein
MRRALVSVLVLTLLAAGGALAGRGDPQERFTTADQKRAKAMLLRASDVPGFMPYSSGPESDAYCKALDESDLTLTGKAESPLFRAQAVAVSSFAHIYGTVADADASWRRGASAAGERCIRRELGRDGTLVSMRRKAFPRAAPKTIAYRLVGALNGVDFYVDFIVLQRTRAQAGIVFGSGLAPVPQDVQVRFARLVGRRMTSAMRGA